MNSEQLKAKFKKMGPVPKRNLPIQEHLRQHLLEEMSLMADNSLNLRFYKLNLDGSAAFSLEDGNEAVS